MASSRFAEKNTCVSGIGQSEINRNSSVLPFELAVRACEQAIADAGLEPSDIKGASCWPAMPAGTVSGAGAAGIADIAASLGLSLAWHDGSEMAGPISPIINAVAAIAAGYADHVLCWRAVGERWTSGVTHGAVPADWMKPEGWLEYMLPYHAPSAAIWIACQASSHMARYGITREHLSAVVISQRRHAGLNPKALYRKPLDLDAYLSARMIATPFSMLDCDVPCNGATAMVISRRGAVRRIASAPVAIEAVGIGAAGRIDTWLARPDYPRMALHDAAEMLWSRTDLTPDDVDTAHLYDGFSWLPLVWLEALGFCREGESGDFVEGGVRIGLEGSLPLNTNGGQLSEGRMHGFGHVHEAVLQLRGQAGARQVARARVSVVGAGGGSFGGALLLCSG